MQRKASVSTQGFLSQSRSEITLETFIEKLDRQLEEQKLIIINGPDLNSREKLLAAQQAIQELENVTNQYVRITHTTEGLMYLAATEDKPADIQAIHAYYKAQINKTSESKKCTCVNLCAVVLDLAILNNCRGSNITVEICQLANWSHMLMRFSQVKKDGDIENLFYDPWYQRCYIDNTNEAKIFFEADLGKEMKNLSANTRMIQPTTQIVDWEKQCMVTNMHRDYSYFVVYSSNGISNPCSLVADPTQIKKQNCCRLM